MTENLRYPKTIESQICLDEMMLDQNNFLNNKNSNNFPKKSIINDKKNNNIFHSNILLISIQDFFNRYEKDDKKILSNKRFLISFQDLISLIKETIIAQQQIDNLIYCDDNNDINIQRINQKYINNLSYNIFSYDKINISYNFNIKKQKNNLPNISPNIMKFKNNPKMKKSYISQESISPNNIKKEINSIFENIYKEVFINGNNPLDNINQRNPKKIKLKSKNILKTNNNIYERNKSATINKKDISPLRYYKLSKNRNGNQRLNNTIITNNISNNINYNNNNININNNYNSHYKKKYSLSADKNLKYDKNNNIKIKKSKMLKNVQNKNDKDELKCSDIFLACENINMIKNAGNKRLLSRSNNSFTENYNNKNYTDIIGYEELYLNNGIKKIIVSNAHKPSNLANKLLISGQKYIDDFKEMNEGKKKKNI